MNTIKTPPNAQAGRMRLLPGNALLLDKAVERLLSQLPHDPELRATLPDPDLMQQIHGKATSIEAFLEACRVYAHKPALAFCPPGEEAYQTMTFGQVMHAVQSLATGLTQLGSLARGQFLALAGYSSKDWVLADCTGLYLGCPVVPIPLNVMPQDSVLMMQETEAKCIFCSMDEVETMINILPSCPAVITVVLMDTCKTNNPDTVKAHMATLRRALPPSTVLLSIEDLLESGAKAPAFTPPAIPGQDGHPRNPLISLMYTSGSSGTPKGGMFKESCWVEFFKSGFGGAPAPIPVVNFACLPLNHVVGRLTVFRSFSTGGITYFIRKPDMSTLLADLQVARPTTLTLIPRISNILYEMYLSRLAEIPTDLAGGDRKAAEDKVREWAAASMGARLVFVMSGTAPTSPEVLKFFSDVVGVGVIDLYGSTEHGGMTVDHHINSFNIKQYKLVSVPELGYTVEDKPYPRGELRVKSKFFIAGYYKDPEKSKELVDEEGFSPTGDIMEERAPGVMYWCDRVKNILKLAQGEFVSLWRLEAFFSGSPLIHQIYLYGNSLRSFLVGVVVPSDRLVSSFPPEEHENVLKDELHKISREHSLQPYEVPHEFIIEYEPFSKANSLLTDSNKPARANLKKRYGDQLEALYATLEDKARRRREAVVRGDGGATVEEMVWGAVERTLGVDRQDVRGRKLSFVQLGGDSMGAVRLVEHVERLSGGVRLPVSAVLNPTASIDKVVELVAELMKAPDQLPKERVEAIQAADLTLQKFFSPEDLQQAKSLTGGQPLPSAAKNVLLTGANGFLGRFVALEALKAVAPLGGRVFCLVRAQSDEQAWKRMMQAYHTSDGKLRDYLERFRSSLVVLAGDVELPRLGLSQVKWEELSVLLDTIIHAGALVNHALSYEQLYPPNVLGTVEVMKLAMTGAPKALSFISSVAVAYGTGFSMVTESQYGTRLQEVRKVGSGYAAGYASSKWACEVLLERLAEECGVLVKMFRCSLILAHREWLGQINASDFLTRLFCGLVYTNLAPASLLAQPEGKNHFDGSPVDFVAEAITALSLKRDGEKCVMYHCINPHEDDGVSLDVMVRWLEETGGFQFERVEDYSLWVKTFQARLEALEGKKKAQSPLAILDQWRDPKPPSSEGTRLDASVFRQGVKSETKWGDVPLLDAAFIRRCLEHMDALELITLEQ